MLLLGTSRLGASLSSQAYLAPLLKCLKKDDLFRVCICTGLKRGQSTSWVKPNGVVLASPHVNLPVLSILSFQLFQMRIGGILRQIEEHIERFKPEVLWFVLNLAQIIRIADRLRYRTSLPFFSMVWDTPERILSLSPSLSQSLRVDLMSEFSNVMRHSKCVSVVSQGMEQHVRDLGASRTVIMYPAISDYCGKKVLVNDVPRSDRTTVRIVFAGTLYAIHEWNAFLKAIDRWNASRRRLIQLDFIGHFPRRQAELRSWIQRYPTKPLDETIQFIKGAHIAYLPYHLSAMYRLDVQTSFPSKLSSYIAAGTPVFLHGPTDSSAARFLEAYHVGRTCSSTDVNEIVKTLESLLEDKLFLNQYADARYDALEHAIGERVLLTNFLNAIGTIRR